MTPHNSNNIYKRSSMGGTWSLELNVQENTFDTDMFALIEVLEDLIEKIRPVAREE